MEGQPQQGRSRHRDLENITVTGPPAVGLDRPQTFPRLAEQVFAFCSLFLRSGPPNGSSSGVPAGR